MNITKSIRRMAIAAALGATVATGVSGVARADGTWMPETIVATSPAGRMDAPADASTYLYAGRTRVTLPDDVVAELNAWAEGYSEWLAEWSAEDGPEWDVYYGGLEEGFNYATQTLLSRLGYLDGHYRDGDSTVLADPDSTLRDAPDGWDSDTFIHWEDASFGSVD